jgi:hypothetical protein
MTAVATIGLADPTRGGRIRFGSAVAPPLRRVVMPTTRCPNYLCHRGGVHAGDWRERRCATESIVVCSASERHHGERAGWRGRLFITQTDAGARPCTGVLPGGVDRASSPNSENDQEPGQVEGFRAVVAVTLVATGMPAPQGCRCRVSGRSRGRCDGATRASRAAAVRPRTGVREPSAKPHVVFGRRRCMGYRSPRPKMCGLGRRSIRGGDLRVVLQ